MFAFESSKLPPTVLKERRDADLLRMACGSSKGSDCQRHGLEHTSVWHNVNNNVANNIRIMVVENICIRGYVCF